VNPDPNHLPLSGNLPQAETFLMVSDRRPAPRGKRHSSGFSLIEVVMAVGVAAFALVALLGLLPAGLSTFKSTMNTSMGSQIAQRIFNDLQVADWNDITNAYRFFDDQGTELTNANASNAFNCIYWVQIKTANTNTGNNATDFLGNTSTNLITVSLLIANNPSHLPAAKVFSGTNPNTLSYTSFIGHK
jgi:uncharacterized protein (TIGR02598 family)